MIWSARRKEKEENLKIPVSDQQLKRFDEFLSRRPVALIGIVLCIYGFLMFISPQHQYVPAIISLSIGGLIDITVVAGLLLLYSRQRKTG